MIKAGFTDKGMLLKSEMVNESSVIEAGLIDEGMSLVADMTDEGFVQLQS